MYKPRILLLSTLTAVFFSAVSFPVMAAQGRILDKIEAEQADSAAFNAEAELFKSIGLSIALSIAQCNSQPDCQPVVDKSELDTLLDKLDDRINRLVAKQDEGKEDYTEILTAYVNERENFLKYQEKLDALSAPSEEAAPEEEQPFAEEAPAATTTEAAPQEQSEFSVFEDIDEALPGEAPPGAGAPDELSDEPIPEE